MRIGQIVGKAGSTGRSTGPHLHYETRVEGEAVDPQKFLRAGVRLGGALGRSFPLRMTFSENRCPPRIRSGAGVFGVMRYSTSSTCAGPPPKALRASVASMNWSRSPSSTPPVLEVCTPVRRSFTIW